MCVHVQLAPPPVLRACDLIDPAPEAADASVKHRRGGVTAAVTPGDHASEHPPPRVALAHQPAARVALAVVAMETAGVRGTASAQRSVAGEAVAVALLTLPWQHQRHPGCKDRV